jgi:hypothetical protein
MSFTYEQFRENPEKVKARSGLVLGFSRVFYDEGEVTGEELYAVFLDGRVKVARTETVTVNFNAEGRIWKDTDAVPGDAEYIGQYVANM